ncbi:MAG: tRNA pseudouridine(38-40) synthase TruA [Bacteroidota bacterium]
MSGFRYFIELSYKGTAYCGWQVQPNAVAVQEVLNKALSTLLRSPGLETVGCGRTDAGVHATLFYAHFDLDHKVKEKEEIFIYKINSLLPEDVAVSRLIPLHPEAHARFDATRREYKYYIHFKKDPFSKETSVYQAKVPDMELMNKAAATLLNVSDFTSFAKLHADAKTNICKVTHARWEQTEKGMCFTISADRFLRNMVRAIVGTLLLVGNRKITLDQFRDIIIQQDRGSAGMSAPAQGLFLTGIEYPYLSII